jgi:hypothetical protein
LAAGETTPGSVIAGILSVMALTTTEPTVVPRGTLALLIAAPAASPLPSETVALSEPATVVSVSVSEA